MKPKARSLSSIFAFFGQSRPPVKKDMESDARPAYFFDLAQLPRRRKHPSGHYASQFWVQHYTGGYRS